MDIFLYFLAFCLLAWMLEGFGVLLFLLFILYKVLSSDPEEPKVPEEPPALITPEDAKLTPMEQCVADGNVWVEDLKDCI